jgi:hypothetical protein
MSDLVEYKPGTPFPGVIGRTLDESSPAWPQPVRAKEGAPNVIYFVWDDVGYGQMSPFGGLCNTPTWKSSPAGACATPTSTPPPSVRPRGAVCSPGATTMPWGCRPLPKFPLAIRPTMAIWALSTAFSPKCCWSMATTPLPWASGTWLPRKKPPPLAPSTAGPWGAVSSATTAS